MGHTIEQWNTRVLRWLKDATGRDVQAPTIADIGIEPALATYASDRPRDAVTEVAGNDTDALDALPEWIAGGITSVEYPVGENPPSYLDPADYYIGRHRADVDADALYFPSTVGSTLKVRVRYAGPWPMPTTTAADDRVPDAAFPMVTALAAAYVCRHLATEASRDRMAAMPTDYIGGRDRTTQLLTVANALEDIYRRYIGLPATGSTGGTEGAGTSRPAYGRIDTNPSRGWAIFHGGPR